MDPNRFKKVDIFPIIHPITMNRDMSKKLNLSLCTPDPSVSYSMCIEYIMDWFKSGFVDNFFRSEYIDAKNIFDDTRNMNKQDLAKRPKPALTVIPKEDQEFNRENLDLYNYGTNLYYNKCSYKDAFFKDFDSRSYVSIAMQIMKMNFQFRIKVSTMALAKNIASFMKIKYRSMGTQGREVDMDFHVPDALMLKMATDAGFETEHGKVKDSIGFMYYLNSHSVLPFIFKLNTATGNYKYFIKMSNMYVHIRSNEVQVDDGERQGHIMNNYIIDFNVDVRFPSPKFYAYYSISVKETIEAANYDGSYGIYNLAISKVPKTNSKGWPVLLSTDYVDDVISNTVSVIKFDDLLGDLRQIMDHTKSQYLSPSLFIEFKLFNNAKEIGLDVNWNDYTITTKEVLEKMKSFIVIYVNLEYMNEQNLILKDSKNERINFMKSKLTRG